MKEQAPEKDRQDRIRPTLVRSKGTKELEKNNCSCQKEDRRSSLQKQSHSKEFNDGRSLTKALWINDDLTDLKQKLRELSVDET